MTTNTFDSDKVMTVLGVHGRLTHRTIKPGQAPELWFKQRWVSETRTIPGLGRVKAYVRFDDECGNKHNTFTITGDIWYEGGGTAGGCCHDEIAQAFPELAPLIKWHLFDTSGPMHYVANTVYHALQHGSTHAWVYYTGVSDPLGIGGTKERLLDYKKASKAKEVEGVDGYRVEWDDKTIKTQNLEHARSAAVWPEATDEQLNLPKDELEKLLLDRLPGLVAEFRAVINSLGFLWSPEEYKENN